MATTHERSQSLKSPETRGTQDAIFSGSEIELLHRTLKILLAGWLAILVSLSFFLGGISAFGSQDPAGPAAPYGDIFSGDPVPRVTCLRRCLNLGKHSVDLVFSV